MLSIIIPVVAFAVISAFIIIPNILPISHDGIREKCGKLKRMNKLELIADSSTKKESVSNVQETEAGKNFDTPLNILLLYADDWRHDTLGVAEGGSIVKTPFLDLLAKQGVSFRYNCVTTSICWISRATLLTGQFYSRHK